MNKQGNKIKVCVRTAWWIYSLSEQL